MTDVNLGSKFECFKCGTRFYDLGKREAVCPKCGADQKDQDQTETPLVSPSVRQSARQRRKVEVASDVEPDIDDVDESDVGTDEIEDVDDEEFEDEDDDADIDEKLD